MAWQSIGPHLGKTYTIATEGGKNKYGSPVMLAHLVCTTLNYDNLSGAFQTGDTVTGGTSSATATVQYASGSFLLIGSIENGPFQNDEQITGSESGATADVDGATVDGEPKVTTVDTSSLGQATVLVADDGADESFVDSKMVVYAT
jgi:hypothetical protein